MGRIHVEDMHDAGHQILDVSWCYVNDCRIQVISNGSQHGTNMRAAL